MEADTTDAQGNRKRGSAQGGNEREPDAEGTNRSSPYGEREPDAEGVGEIAKETVFGLKYDIGCSRRYSTGMASRYGVWAKSALFVNLIGGSAVFGQAVGDIGYLALIGSVMIVLATLASIAFDWSGKASFYQYTYKQYTLLYEQLVRLGDHPEDNDLRKIRMDYVSIEKDEPAVNYDVMLRCEIEESNFRRADEPHIQSLIDQWSALSKYRRFWAQFPNPSTVHAIAVKESASDKR